MSVRLLFCMTLNVPTYIIFSTFDLVCIPTYARETVCVLHNLHLNVILRLLRAIPHFWPLNIMLLSQGFTYSLQCPYNLAQSSNSYIMNITRYVIKLSRADGIIYNTCGSVLSILAPSFFPVAYNLVKPFLHEQTRSRIRVFGCKWNEANLSEIVPLNYVLLKSEHAMNIDWWPH